MEHCSSCIRVFFAIVLSIVAGLCSIAVIIAGNPAASPFLFVAPLVVTALAAGTISGIKAQALIEIAELNGAIAGIRTIGAHAMVPEVLMILCGCVSIALRSVVEAQIYRAGWSVLKTIVWTEAVLVPLSGIGFIVLHGQSLLLAGPNWIVLVPLLTPLMLLLTCHGAIPQPLVKSKTELAFEIIAAFVRLSSPLTAMKNGLAVVVDRGLDQLLEVIKKKLNL